MRDVCAGRLGSVARALGLDRRADEFVEVFRTMSGSWGTAGAADLAESDVSSDGSPLEYAVALDEADPVLQFAIEAIERSGDPVSRVALARRTMADLVARYGVSDKRWTAVTDLFLPDGAATGHVAMYGAELRRSGPIGFKIWFYPGVTGPDRSVRLVEQALGRLGLEKAWPSVVAHMRRDEHLDRPILFSLDLSADRAARVKVYYRHYEADDVYVSGLMAGYPGFARQPVLDFCAMMLTGDGRLAHQPPVSCLTFTGDGGDRVEAATLYVPMWTYAPDDEVVRARVRALLACSGVSGRLYERVLGTVATRPLHRGRGLHNYVAWRPGGGRAQVKIYFSPELRHVNPAPRYRPATSEAPM